MFVLRGHTLLQCYTKKIVSKNGICHCFMPVSKRGHTLRQLAITIKNIVFSFGYLKNWQEK